MWESIASFIGELWDAFWDLLLGGAVIFGIFAMAFGLSKLWILVALIAWKHSALTCILVIVITMLLLGITSLVIEDIS